MSDANLSDEGCRRCDRLEDQLVLAEKQVKTLRAQLRVAFLAGCDKSRWFKPVPHVTTYMDCAETAAREYAASFSSLSSEVGATMPECMAPDGAQPCAAYTALLNEVVELRKLCALKQREHAKTYLQREPDKGRLSSSDTSKGESK